MKFYADLHIHSAYSRATSKALTLENLHAWSQIKGIQVVGTGDCLHPTWFADMKAKLTEDGSGLLTLKSKYVKTSQGLVPEPCTGNVRYMLTTEISNIYKKDGAVRKVHNVVCMPTLASVEKLFKRLEKIGNLRSDGRPILGLDSRNLLEIVLESDKKGLLIPAHIWTPWFSALGSKSGFDSIQACYGDLTNNIYAVETGLSSDPSMNWRISSLDPFACVSFSDAHSPNKLGREATIFDTDLSFESIHEALANPKSKALCGTVEFFPEEGKYHYDGHRDCKIRFTPRETIAHKGICPVCKKPLTVGVMARVEALADRKEGAIAPRSKPFTSLIPLIEIIGEAFDCGTSTKKAVATYQLLSNTLGGEFFILQDAKISDIKNIAGDIVAEGISRMRNGKLSIDAGYDGEFGTVKIFTDEERIGFK